MAIAFLKQNCDDLKNLLDAVLKRVEAANTGTDIPAFSVNELTEILCCVGDALITTHRAKKTAETTDI